MRYGSLLVSYDEQLYVVGGVGSYSRDEGLMMTCMSETENWNAVECNNEPTAGLSCACAGECTFP